MFYYNGIEADSITDLINSEKFPLKPDTVKILDTFQSPNINEENFGQRLVSFFKVS